MQADDVVELRIQGDIIDDGSAWYYEWFEEDYIAPNSFRNELKNHDGKEVHVIIDSFGGDVFAGTSIYSDLKARNGKTVGIVHSKAMSSATIILMGCDEIRISPTAMLMIHDPITGVYGDISVVEQTLKVLNEVKESILNAYIQKTGRSREELSNMMTNETWMSAHKAVELGFADSVIDEGEQPVVNNFSVGRLQITNSMTSSVEKFKKLNEERVKAENAKQLEIENKIKSEKEQLEMEIYFI